MRTPTFSALAANVFHEAYRSITTQGTHLSAELDSCFKTLRPSQDEAYWFRHRLFQAIRYANAESAWHGNLDAVNNPSQAFVPPWLSPFLPNTCWLDDAPTFIRVNTLKTSVQECFTALAPFHPTVVEDTCIRLDKPFGLYRSVEFGKGWFEQQDLASQQVGVSIQQHAMQSKPAMVLDLCAGGGGKTLHLAALLGGTSRVIATDIQANKLIELRKRASRAGAHNVETRHISGSKVLKRLYEKADIVLVDAPCSGTGVLRRNPDILHHLTEHTVQHLVATQAQLLNTAFKLCKPNGYVAYVTCSILPQECTQQIQKVCAEHPLTVAHEWQRNIGYKDGDGFYFCLLARTQ